MFDKKYNTEKGTIEMHHKMEYIMINKRYFIEEIFCKDKAIYALTRII